VAKLLGLPVVGSYHTELGPYALHLTRDLVVAEAMSSYVDWFYGRCDVVLAPTAAVAADLERRQVTSQIEVWSRGVDAAVFSPARRRQAVRDELLGDGTVVLLSVGRLSAEKRLDVLLASFELASAEEPGLRLAIVGDGPARDELMRRTGARVSFVGELHGAELAAAYASADVFCFPSTTDTFGQVLLEAGASGLPVVAAAAGGALDLVQPGRSGLLVPPDDAAAFATAILRLARDRALRAALGRGGVAAAAGRTWARSITELRAAYRLVGARDEVPVLRPRAA
jgi:glycosyltransferase involved in cell wall biosynthesis